MTRTEHMVWCKQRALQYVDAGETAEEILVKAAELVERPGGWCQGELSRGEAVCLIGALIRASGWSDTNLPARVASQQAIQKEIGPVSMVLWNNAPGREAVEVATMLRNAKRWLP